MKQALRASGANTTAKHIEEVSLAALFLLQAAKKSNEEFSVVHTTAHTVRDVQGDSVKMTNHLMEKNVTVMTPGRQSSPFVDLTDKGWEKMSTGWLQKVLERTSEEHLHTEVEREGEDRVVDFDYELSD